MSKTHPTTISSFLDDFKVDIHFKENSIPSIHRGLLTKESKDELLAAFEKHLLSLIPEKKERQLHSAHNNGELMDDFESKGWNACIDHITQILKEYKESIDE